MRSVLLFGALIAPAVAAAEAAQIAQRIDDLHRARHVPARMQELVEVTERALKEHPDDAALLWRAARLAHWRCDGAEGREKEALGRRAWELGERAVAADPSKVEGHYYAAVGIGCYSQAVGVLRALAEGLEGKFNQRLDKAVAEKPAHDHAGPLIAKGRYFYELPWPKRDLEKSALFLERAIRTEPAALRAYLYLAETQLKDGAPQKAKATLTRALQGEEGYDVAEARRVKALATRLMKSIEEELK